MERGLLLFSAIRIAVSRRHWWRERREGKGEEEERHHTACSIVSPSALSFSLSVSLPPTPTILLSLFSLIQSHRLNTCTYSHTPLSFTLPLSHIRYYTHVSFSHSVSQTKHMQILSHASLLHSLSHIITHTSLWLRLPSVSMIESFSPHSRKCTISEWRLEDLEGRTHLMFSEGTASVAHF